MRRTRTRMVMAMMTAGLPETKQSYTAILKGAGPFEPETNIIHCQSVCLQNDQLLQ